MSACAPTDRIMQTLRVQAPGATDPIIQLQLFNVMDEFFRRTSAWRYEDDITLVEGETEYGFGVPADSMVVRLIAVNHNGVPVASAQGGGVVQHALGTLEPDMTFPDGDADFAPALSDLDSGGVFSYAIYRPNYISVTTPPDEEKRKYPLKALLALTLAPSCIECDCGDWSVPDWMYDTFFQDWLDGTLGRLYAMPAKPWSSPVHAQYHGRRFRNAMAQRKPQANKGFTYGIPGWRFPRGGWTR